MAFLRNKTKVATVSRETPESSRGSRGRNALDPELTQDYISQVSEEIEGRVTKKLSKEFNKTESRILGALSKFDEFLLNPQVRTCSVVQGAPRNANSGNRETHGDRSSNDPYPERGYFPHHSGQLNSPETEFNSHVVTETYPHREGIEIHPRFYRGPSSFKVFEKLMALDFLFFKKNLEMQKIFVELMFILISVITDIKNFVKKT